jgi:hypothetical protein
VNALKIYEGSDAALTKSFYEALGRRGTIGTIAMNLFRAQKCSARAKKYRGGIRGKGFFRDMAYERKAWSMQQLCVALSQGTLAFGWKKDGGREFGPEWVLYVDLPEGQVSFHSYARYQGPDYPGEWDKQKASAERIVRFAQRVLDGDYADVKSRELDTIRAGEVPSVAPSPEAYTCSDRRCSLLPNASRGSIPVSAIQLALFPQ